jgi:hypothetical protein
MPSLHFTSQWSPIFQSDFLFPSSPLLTHRCKEVILSLAVKMETIFGELRFRPQRFFFQLPLPVLFLLSEREFLLIVNSIMKRPKLFLFRNPLDSIESLDRQSANPLLKTKRSSIQHTSEKNPI